MHFLSALTTAATTVSSTTCQFECDNGDCISESKRCDSDDDCGDKSDEEGCGKGVYLYLFACILYVFYVN